MKHLKKLADVLRKAHEYKLNAATMVNKQMRIWKKMIAPSEWVK